MKFKFLFLLSAISYALLTIYSFSQVDLNLTLSSYPLYQSFQKQLTHLGYFNRPLSTAIYIALIIFLFSIFYLLSSAAKKKLITIKQLWFLIILTVIILLPSYPAFSHDIFNYMFDARIVTKYATSPWHYRALDFPADPWTRFMRWTHRPSVYPPAWIGLSLIPSILGLGKFTPTLFLFKFMLAGFYLASIGLILQLTRLLQHDNTLLPAVLFAFNPLVLIETLVNGHMEIGLIFFALLAIYLSLKRKTVLSWLSLIGSIGIKYMTFYLTPVLFRGEKLLRLSVWIGFIFTSLFVIWYGGFQPWYVLWVLPFTLLLPTSSREIKFINFFSLAALFWNLPLVSSGDFNLPHPTTRLINYGLIPFASMIIISTIVQKIINLQSRNE